MDVNYASEIQADFPMSGDSAPRYATYFEEVMTGTTYARVVKVWCRASELVIVLAKRWRLKQRCAQDEGEVKQEHEEMKQYCMLCRR